MKLGMPSPRRPKPCPATSPKWLTRDAANTPIATPTRPPSSVARMASSIVTGNASAIRLRTGWPLVTETPKLPVSTLPSHEKNCLNNGWSSP